MAYLPNNAWYFKNGLVRANYTKIEKGMFKTTKYFEMLLRNLILNEKRIEE